MATSGTYVNVSTRDQIITDALYIVGGIGEGETPTAAAVTQAALVLNKLVKAMASKGMPLWSITDVSVTLVAGTATYSISNALKVLQGLTRTTVGTNQTDVPMIPLTHQDYLNQGNKLAAGKPTQYWYQTPGNLGSGAMTGTMTLYPVPDTTTAGNTVAVFTVVRPFQDFSASTDNPHFPSYWELALTWLLANELVYRYHVPLAERSMITKQALYWQEEALSYGTEEGSLYIQPEPSWDD